MKSLIPEICVLSNNTDKYCVVKENGKKYTLENVADSTVKKIKVDGCFSQKSGEKRCDFLLTTTNDNNQKAIFIELKGCGLHQALKQILETMQLLQAEIKNHEVLVRIVGKGSDVPNFRVTPAYRKIFRIIKTEKNFHHATNGSHTDKL